MGHGSISPAQGPARSKTSVSGPVHLRTGPLGCPECQRTASGGHLWPPGGPEQRSVSRFLAVRGAGNSSDSTGDRKPLAEISSDRFVHRPACGRAALIGGRATAPEGCFSNLVLGRPSPALDDRRPELRSLREPLGPGHLHPDVRRQRSAQELNFRPTLPLRGSSSDHARAPCTELRWTFSPSRPHDPRTGAPPSSG